MTTTTYRPAPDLRELAAAKVSMITGVTPKVRFTDGAFQCVLRETPATPSYDTMAAVLAHAGCTTVQTVPLTRAVLVRVEDAADSIQAP